VVVVLLWLGGRGAGWFDSGTARPVVTPQPATPAPVAGAVPSSMDPVPLAESEPRHAAAAVAPPVPAPSVAAVPDPTPTVASNAATIDDDRFASQLALVTVRTDAGEVGQAMASLRRLQALPLDPLQRAALLQPAERLEQALAAAAGRIVQAMLRGEVLQAHHELQHLVGDSDATALPLLDSALQLAGLRGSLLAPADEGVHPIARPLARGREVRWWREREVERGRIVDSRSDVVTVRAQRGDAVVFPTLRAVEVEPVEVTADEAVELGFGALQAGHVMLARLWLGCAVSRRAGAAPSRQQQLAALLP
jgi:hypothetical protein